MEEWMKRAEIVFLSVAFFSILCMAGISYGAPIHEAVEKGDMGKVKEIIKGGGDVNDTGDPYTGKKPIHLACEKGDYAMVKYLVGQGADIDARDVRNARPIHYAVEAGSLEVVRYLVSVGAVKNFPGGLEERTPVHYAAANPDGLAILKFLVEKGADFKSVDRTGATPLHVAAYSGNLESLIYLEGKGLDIDAKALFLYKSTPLHEAVHNGSLDVAKYLLQKGADIEARDVMGKSPLFIAAEEGHLELVELLVEKGADINTKDDSGLSILMGIEKQSKETEANVNASPMENSIFDAYREIIKYLRSKGATYIDGGANE